MKYQKTDIFYTCLICIIACVFIFDLMMNKGIYAAFDTPFHITNIAQFYLALKAGDFPVVWTDGFANYGLPIPIVAHQLTSYLGGGLTFLTHNPVSSFAILAFVGIFLSSLFYYIFLRIYFKPHIAFLATFIFTFSPYRIINFYIRGALPEIFSNMFLPLILIASYFFIKQKKTWAFYLIILSFFLLSLNHPMMLLIYAFVYMPYVLFLFLVDDGKLQLSWKFLRPKLPSLFLYGVGVVMGIGMASYYLIPLNQEIKYFYYGLTKNHLTPDSYLSWKSYFVPSWEYFTNSEIFTRGHIIQVGIVESVGMVIGIFYTTRKLFKDHTQMPVTIVEFSVLTGILIFLFTTPLTNSIYIHVDILSNIQFPWRVLSSFIFLPPLIYAYLLRNRSKYLILPIMLIVVILSFPQLYGKNYVQSSNAIYYFNPVNAHSVLMNTIWSGKSEDYLVERQKVGIIEGNGVITNRNIQNASRKYVVDAKTDMRLVDYTFYFPGWKAYIDNHEVPIEFQDPHYRGVITYNVPKGKHTISLIFTDTRVRFMGKLITLAFFYIFLLLLIIKKRLSAFITRYA